MKKLVTVFLCLAALAYVPAFSQPASKAEVTVSSQSSPLTKFSIDFPGGTPQQLVAAIQKATNRPLNVFIPSECAAWKLPAIKMDNVNVSQLFKALTNASMMSSIPSKSNEASDDSITSRTRYGIQSVDTPLTDDSVWSFFGLSEPQVKEGKQTSFFLLKPYLDAGLTVDDITTAIQTGWQMQGTPVTAKLSFHKETKLLIASGSISQLALVENALHTLDALKSKRRAAVPVAPEKPAEEKKADQ